MVIVLSCKLNAMTFSRKNINKRKPLWFIKLKRIVTVLSDAAIVILLGIGFSENSLILLILRLGVSAILNSIEIFLSDENDE